MGTAGGTEDVGEIPGMPFLFAPNNYDHHGEADLAELQVCFLLK